MRLVAAVAARLMRSDLAQAAALMLAAVAAALIANWPYGGARVNESWAAVAPLRSSAMALLGVAFGARQAVSLGGPTAGADVDPAVTAQSGGAFVTWLALLAVALFTWPLELAAQAGSYPAVPGYWSALVAPLGLSGYFGLGLLLGSLVRGRFAGALLVMLVPAVCTLLVWSDLALGVVATNPWAAPAAVSPVYLACMLALCVVGLLVGRAIGRVRP